MREKKKNTAIRFLSLESKIRLREENSFKIYEYDILVCLNALKVSGVLYSSFFQGAAEAFPKVTGLSGSSCLAGLEHAQVL